MNTELFCFCSFFLYWFFPCYSHLSQLILKNLIIEFSKKHDQTYINLTNVSDVIGYVIGYRVWWDQIWLCTFTKYTKINNNAIIYISELILTPFSSLDTLNAKNLWKYIFRAIFRTSRRVRFPYFPKVPLDHGDRCPLIPFRVFMDHVTIFSSSPMQQLRWSSSWQLIGNSWKLLLTVFRDICPKCDPAPPSVSEIHRWT